MRKNLELKALYPSLKLAKAVCKRLGIASGGILRQTDTYFRITKGRLKLREINGRECELIYYRRNNSKGTRYSDYIVVPLKKAEPMKELCGKVFGIKVIVKKTRVLYLYENARIHIDTVEKLGTFVEFEVMVERGRAQAKRLMRFLISEFEISMRDVLGSSYSDLIARSKGNRLS